MPQDNDAAMWPMERSAVVQIVEYAKSQPSLEAARPFIGLLDNGFRGVNNREAFELIDSITTHFKDEYRQVLRRQAEELSEWRPPQKELDIYPALGTLCKLVRDGKGPKDTLMPYRAALQAGVLLPSMPSVKDFNKLFGTDLSAGNYSTYINAADNPYEKDKDVSRFRTLVKQFKNFQ